MLCKSASCSTGEYGAAVLIAVLLFSETTVAKLAAHAIAPSCSTPEPVDPGAWHVRTAWEASASQVSRYRRDR